MNRLFAPALVLFVACSDAGTTDLDASVTVHPDATSIGVDAIGNADAVGPTMDAADPTMDAAATFADADTPGVDAAQTFPDAAQTFPDAAQTFPDAAMMPLPRFSFFVTSLESMRRLSGSMDGFGGDLRYGEATGLAGADKICTEIAEAEMPGAGAKGWRAYLSTSTGGPNGGPVHAIDRVGNGPWYDRNQRPVAMNRAGLQMERPAADAQIINDLPNERGESQVNQPGPNANGLADNHDVITGSNSTGQYSGGAMSTTCNDWTSVEPRLGRPYLGHSWPAMSGRGWTRAHPAAGCAAAVNLVQNGPGARDCFGVGCGGGYGGIYCFALQE